MNCPKCGTLNRPTAKFCKNCASPLALSSASPGSPAPASAYPPAPLTNQSSAAAGAVVCPNCQRSDVLTAAQANLAQPVKPPTTLVTLAKIFQWLAVGMASFIAVFSICAVVLTLATSAAASASMSNTASTLACFGPLAALVGLPLLLLIPALALPVILFILVRRWVERSYNTKLAEWQRAMNKWQQLYYCPRDAGVFLPGQARLVPLEQMQPFIYELEHRAMGYPGYGH